MPFDEVVVREVKTDRCDEVLILLAKGVGEASQTAHVKPRRRVQPFHIAGGNQVNVRSTPKYILPRMEYARCAVTTFPESIGAVHLHYLRVIHVCPKRLCNCF